MAEISLHKDEKSVDKDSAQSNQSQAISKKFKYKKPAKKSQTAESTKRTADSNHFEATNDTAGSLPSKSLDNDDSINNSW